MPTEFYHCQSEEAAGQYVVDSFPGCDQPTLRAAKAVLDYIQREGEDGDTSNPVLYKTLMSQLPRDTPLVMEELAFLAEVFDHIRASPNDTEVSIASYLPQMLKEALPEPEPEQRPFVEGKVCFDGRYLDADEFSKREQKVLHEIARQGLTSTADARGLFHDASSKHARHAALSYLLRKIRENPNSTVAQIWVDEGTRGSKDRKIGFRKSEEVNITGTSDEAVLNKDGGTSPKETNNISEEDLANDKRSL